MNIYLLCFAVCLVIQPHSARVILRDYLDHRNDFIKEEILHSIGGDIQLNEDEKLANDILMKNKYRELDSSPDKLSKHYFTYRSDIINSEVYKIIKEMPKGGALHIHSSLMLDADHLLSLTYEDHLYACYKDDDLQFLFSNVIPDRPCSHNWTLLSELRNASEDVAALDMQIKNHFTLHLDDRNINIDQTAIWERFDKVYYAIKSLISYRPVREKFFYQSLKNFYDDNVMYIEIRGGLHSLYELDGAVHDRIYMARLYKSIVKKFKEEYPDFIGVKYIFTKNRRADIEEVHKSISIARFLQTEMPDMFAGFDFVGQEDLGNPLLHYITALLDAKDGLQYYFHGGETNKFGTDTDENLIDAVLLGSKRIGHGYALPKHPELMDILKRNDIAVEVNVISNQVLSLVDDIRNHPLANFMAMGLPVVLSSDDPGAWGAEPLSHDFYVAFVGVASRRADLRMLKQLAINSIKYCTLEDTRKAEAFGVFYRRWDQFIANIIKK